MFEDIEDILSGITFKMLAGLAVLLLLAGWLVNGGLDQLGLTSKVDGGLKAVGINVKWSDKPQATPWPSVQPAATATVLPTATPEARPSVLATVRPTVQARPSATTAPLIINGSGPSVDGNDPFFEYVTPIKPGDFTKLKYLDIISLDQEAQGQLVLDLSGSYLGAAYLYQGDTLGVKLKLFNSGEALDRDVVIHLDLAKYIEIPGGCFWTPALISKDLTAHIEARPSAVLYKNFTYTIPDMSGIQGVYRIDATVYLNGSKTAGFRKEIQIL
jgi:hypothetical protein